MKTNRKQRRRKTFLRRQQNKEQKIIQKLEKIKPFEKLSHLILWMHYGFQSMKGVGWKRSV